EVALHRQQGDDRRADHLLVVGYHDADHARPPATTTRTKWSSVRLDSTEPPWAANRSASDARPEPAPSSGAMTPSLTTRSVGGAAEPEISTVVAVLCLRMLVVASRRAVVSSGSSSPAGTST